MKSKFTIIVVMVLITLTSTVFAFSYYGNSKLEEFKNIKSKKVQDTTTVAEFRGFTITLGEVLNRKAELEGMNKVTIPESRIIQNMLINQFILLEANKIGIKPISDAQAVAAKEEQLRLYREAPDEIKQMQQAVIEDLGMTFDEYWNQFWVEKYKEAVLISDYIEAQEDQYKGSQNSVEKVKRDIWNKYKREVKFNERFNSLAKVDELIKVENQYSLSSDASYQSRKHRFFPVKIEIY